MRPLGLLLGVLGLVVGLTVAAAVPAEAVRSRSATLSLSSGTIIEGKSVRLSGRVTGTGKGATVRLQRWAGSRWVTSRTVRTTSGGRFSHTLRPSRTGTVAYRAVAPRTKRSATARSATRRVTVLVRTSVRVQTPAPVVTDGQARFVVTVSPTARVPVRLQTLRAGGWADARSATTDASGSATMRHPVGPGSTSFRVVVPRHGGRAPVTSGTTTVTVTPASAPTPAPTPVPTPTPGPTPTPTPTPTPGPTVRVHDVAGTVTTLAGVSPGEVVRVGAAVVVPADVVVTVPDDVVVVSDGDAITVQGTLRVGDGVTFTASADPTVTTGLADARRADRWAGIAVTGAGRAELADALVRRADVALAVDEGASATWRGTVRDAGRGLTAHGHVDARGVDWGSADGPAPYGTGALVVGYGAHVVPWAGHRPEVASAVTLAVPAVTCTDVVVVGVRGSGEGPRGADGYDTDPWGGFGSSNYYVYASLQQALGDRLSTSRRALHYPAYDLFGAPEQTGRWALLAESVDRGAAAVVAEVEAIASACPSASVVLVGSSQGAMVVRAGLGRLSPAHLAHVDAVALVGDPSRPVEPVETFWSSGGRLAGDTLRSLAGQFPVVHLLVGAEEQLEEGIASRTTSLCRGDDIFCSPRAGSSLLGHLDYGWVDHLEPLGREQAVQVLRRR